MIQVGSGMGYWLQPQSSTEIGTGTVLLAAAGTRGQIRASQLDGLSLCFFNVIPARLTGLITFGELEFLHQAASRSEPGSRLLVPHHPIARKMRELRARQDRGGLLSRLTLLELFVAAFGRELERAVVPRTNGDAKARLRSFLAEMPPKALLETSFGELAQMLHCTPRHLNRIFSEAAGMSFRDKRADIQLAQARDLLATSDAKIVDVALESGYKSLSLFNAMFARRFGTSPGRWRQQQAVNGEKEGRRGKPRRFAIS